MPTFIDESGCCGFGPKSQPYFRLVGVWFPTSDGADLCEAALEAFRKEQQLPPGYEFKYSSKLSDRIRTAFFALVARHEFCFAAAHFDKASRLAKMDKETLYRDCVRVLTQSLLDQYQYAEELKCSVKGSPVRLAEKVIADDNKDPFYFRILKDEFFALKSANGKTLIGNVKPGKSKSDRMLQLVDMVCGAVGDHLAGNSEFFNLIRGNALRVVVLPETPGASDETITRPI